MNFKKLFFMLSFVVLFATTAFAQQTWYVNNQIGNDGRNGLSASIPVPDDGVTGPKRTIGGAQGAVAESNAGDIIMVAPTGVNYSTGTGEPATISVTKKLTFRSTGGTPNIAVIFQVNNANASPNNNIVFDSGEFTLSGGLTLTVGVLTNTNQLLTVSGTITRTIAASTVSGQLKYTGTVNFSYGATMTVGDEFPATGTINNLTTTGGNLTLKTSTLTMTGVFTTAGNVALASNTISITNTGAATHTLGGNITGGTLAFSLGGGNATINGAFTLPTVTVTTSTSTARTLAIAQPTAITGSLSVDLLASVTSSAALVTIGTLGNSSNVVTLNGTGTVTLSGAPTTIHGNVLLSTALSTTGLAGGATITFGAAATVNGSVTNNASLTVTNAATWNGMTGGRIVFGDFAYTITGNVVNSTSIGGTLGTTLDVDGFGHITFANVATNVTINGTITNASNTSLSGSTNPADFSNNGIITWGNNITAGIVRADGGISNSSDFSLLTGAANVNNGRIVIGGAARTAGSTIGAAANRAGAVSNSSKGRAAADGNGDIVFGIGDGTAGGFFGTSVSVTGSVLGGYTIFGDEDFNITGSVTNARTHASTALVIGATGAGHATAVVTIGGNVVNQGTGTTTFNLPIAGAIGITGSIQSTANGTITFPNVVASTLTVGGLSVSSGTISIPATHAANATFNGTVSVSGGTVSLLAAGGGETIIITGNASFTGGAFTTTGRTSTTLNSTSITMGGTSANTTFTAATNMIIGNPSPTALSTVTIGTFNPNIPGALVINNTTGLAQAVKFTGGTMTVSGSLTFTAGKVLISDQANISVVGNFTNTAGYSTTEQGRVTIEGAGGQTFGGAGTFGNIEFKNSAGPATSSAVTLTGFIYLTTGAVSNAGGAISIDNSTTFPTIVRNAGSFTAAPTFNSKVNVTYIGDDKASGNELPVATDKLQNLTVATTTGAGGANNVAAKGVVTVAAAATVNGTITINSGQTLLIDAVDLTMKGASIVLNGDIANEGVGQLVLSAATGTTITGAGYLPPINVAASSSGNVIDGAKAIINQLYGTDNEQGGGDDYNPTTTAAQGSIVFATGTNSLSVKLVGVTDGSMVGAITTASANNTLTLAGNLVSDGTLTHVAGTISLGDFALSHRGATFTINGTNPGNITSTATGKLVFAKTGITINVTGGPATIPANVEFNAPGGTVTLASYVATVTDKLILSGNVTLSDNSAGTLGTTVDIGNANTLSLGGLDVTVSKNSKFTATSGGTTGILALINSGTNTLLTLNLPASAEVANLTVDGNVTLAGSITSSTVYVSTALVHNSGALTLGSANVQVGGTAAAPTVATAATFSRTGAAATYSGDGYLIWNSSTAAGFAHSTVAAAGAMTINSLQVMSNFTLQNARNLNVIKNLYLNGGNITNQVGGTGGGYLFVGDATTVPMIRVLLPSNVVTNAIQFSNANADYTFNGPTPSTITSTVWPATATLARDVTVNMAAAINILNLPAGGRTINRNLTLTAGVLTWDNPDALTLGSGSIVTRNVNGSLNKNANADTNLGTLTAPLVNLVFIGGAIGNTGIEYSDVTAVNNLTLGATATAASVTLNTAKTIGGTVSIIHANSVLTLAENTTFTVGQTFTAGTITVNAAKTLTLGAASTLNNINGNVTSTGALTLNGAHTAGTITASNNVTVGTNGSFAVTSNLAFVGDASATITVPSAGATIGGLTINKTNNTNTVTLSGGNLTTTAASTFVNGLFLTGANTLTLWQPNWGGGQGFDRSGVTGTKISHVVGNVAKKTINAGGPGLGGSSESRIEFPVGTTTLYRPVALTFNPAFSLPTVPNATFTVTHTPNSPTGAVGLPIADGVAPGISVARYPGFYWTIASNPSQGQDRPFDLELTATGFTDFDDINNIRIIRRHGLISDVTNEWLLQGSNSSYNNETIGGVPSILQRGANAGLRSSGAIFTLGIKSNMSVNPNDTFVKSINTYKKLWLVFKDGAKNIDISKTFQGNVGSLAFTAQSSNTTIATVSVTGSTLKVTPIATGDAIVTIIASDAANNDFFAYSFPVNVGLTDVEGEELPTEFALYQNFPNPFNPTTNIKFDLPKESNVSIRIFNILGEEVANLVNRVMTAGRHNVEFNASKLTSGMYIYRIEADNFVQVKKMLLMK